jgi:O-antigen ligase
LLHSKILLPVVVGMTIVETKEEVRILAWTLVVCLGYLAYEAHGMYLGGRLPEFRDQGMLGMDNNSFCISMSAGAGLAIFLGFSSQGLFKQLAAFGLAAMMIHVPMFSQSRGGMLGIAVVGLAAFVLLPKRTEVLAVYAVGSLVALRLAGPAVVARFSTIFADSGNRDASAQSRVDLWLDCVDVMIHNPILGIGPDHWPLIAKDYGWPPGKEAHSVWFNCGAELGIVGLSLLLAFYLSSIVLAWRHLCKQSNVKPEFRDIGRMTIAALSGFMVSASFVSLDALEVPFYIVLILVSGLKIACIEAETTPLPSAAKPVVNSSRIPAAGFATRKHSSKPVLAELEPLR